MIYKTNIYQSITNTKRAGTLVLSVVSFIFASCAFVPGNYQRPDINNQVSYRANGGTDTNSIAAIPWRTLFKDKILLSLIEEGLAGNADLGIAVSGIKQAEAGFDQSKLALWPGLTTGATGTVEQSINGGSAGATSDFQLLLSASWEVDVWGKLTSAKRASLAALLESEANRNAVITRLIADIANNYYSLLALDAQLEITQKTVGLRIADVNTMKDLKSNAVVTGAAVVQSEANRYAAEVTIPDIKQNIRTIENSLSILLGRSPGSITRSTLDEQNPVEKVPIGVPAQLLSNRPDVLQAEYAFRYAFEITNAARSAFYPELTITASESITEGKIKDLFNPGTILGNLIGGLTQPIFNKGINTARLETAEAVQEEALFSYKKALLAASGEVSNALYSFETAREKAEVRKKQIEALEKSVEYTKELLAYGSANYTEVLSAEQNLLAAELNRVNDKLQQLQAVVALYRSLGGGIK